MKNTILLVMALTMALALNAQQSPCEKTFGNAKKLFGEKNYTEAKTQFQKVADNCDSNKELAREYIKLCDGFLGLKQMEKEQNALNANASEATQKMKRLEDRNKELEKTNADYAQSLVNAMKTVKSDSLTILRQNETIARLTSDSTKYASEKAALVSSLREMGKELNRYLQKKNKKNTATGLDTISNAPGLIEAMREQLKKAK